MKSVFKGSVLIIGGLLVGYCLAYPVTFATYFYDKPEIDFSVYAVLFTASFYTFWKFLSQKAWFKTLAIALLVLPLIWLKLEFWLYSELNSPQFVTYFLLVILAGALGAILRYEFVTNQSKWVRLIVIPPIIIGFVISLLSSEHLLNELLVILFAIGLATHYLNRTKALAASIVVIGFVLVALSTFITSPQLFERQAKYHDKIVFSKTTDLQVIDVTEWRGNHWFYADGVNQFSSIDSWLFYEPFVYPILELAGASKEILVIGGENGMLVNELRKAGTNNIKLLSLDPELLIMAQNETLFLENNENSLSDSAIQFIEEDVFQFLNSETEGFDLIFVDVADPIDLQRNQYFTHEFYELIRGALRPDGLFVTQSGSPYFATEAFEVVQRTIAAAGFHNVTFHNQILTLGEWSWTIGSVNRTKDVLKEQLSGSSFAAYQTQWLNQEAMQMMLSFGKPTRTSLNSRVNTMKDPVLYQYYLNGNYTLK